MKRIDIDDDLYAFIAGQTKHIGESASDILRRLLMGDAVEKVSADGKSVLQTKKPDNADVALQSSRTSVKNSGQATSSSSTKDVAAVAAAPKTVDQGSITKRLNADVLDSYTKRVDLFLFILAQLHELHQEDFAAVEEIKGKNRVYFATSKEALLKTGSSTNPKQIPDSPYWVVTNNNTAKKVAMLEHVLQLLGYDEETRETVLNRFA